MRRGWFALGIALASCGGAPAREPEPARADVYIATAPPTPVVEERPAAPAAIVLPEGSEVAPAATPVGPLAEIESTYARVLETPIGSDDAVGTLQQAVDDLIAQLTAAFAIVGALDAAAAKLAASEPAPSAAHRSRALTRRADARDALASRIATAPFAIPTELEQTLATTSAATAREVREQIRTRIGATLAPHERTLWCAAAELYADVEAGGGPDAAWAAAQRARYGAAFLQSCAARTPPDEAGVAEPERE